MASLAKEGKGFKVLATLPDKRRVPIRLGRCSETQAEEARTNIEALQASEHPGPLVTRWLRGLPDAVHARLARFGVVESRKPAVGMTLQGILDDYFASLNVKAGTATAYHHTGRYLLRYFGGDKPLADIGPADAQKWKQSLQAAGLSKATVARRVGVARCIFGRAVDWERIGKNPFRSVKAGSQVNRDRMYFVPREDIDKVIAAAPSAEWRLLIALARYGGLRCPSEHLALTWDCIDWEHNRIRVPSPKTAHHAGKDCRIVPLFPELRGPLMEVFDQAEEGTEHVITRYRDTAVNLRTQLMKIIYRAGLVPWPRLWQNLRSSRATELAERYPAHVAAAWLGHTEAIAEAHYWMIGDEYFADAVRDESGPAQKAVQIPVHLTPCVNNSRVVSSEPERYGRGENREDVGKNADTAVLSGTEYPDTVCLVGAGGFEPPKV